MSRMSYELKEDVEEFLQRMFPLHEAAALGRVDVMKYLMGERGFSVNHQSFDMVTPLHQACLHGHTEAIRLLIERGALINARNIDGATPLCDACCHGNVDIVKDLIQRGADVNPKLLLSSPLHEAVLRDNWQCASLLVEAGCNLEATDCHYGTPLHCTAFKDNMACAEVLLKSGADVNSRQFHKMPLHDVARLQDCDLILLLLEHGADVYSKDNRGLTPRDLVPSSTSPAKHLLLHWEVTPRPLQHLSRLIIRRTLQKNRLLSRIDSLLLPKFLKDYLAFR